MKVLILNSGMGSRMGVLTSEHPKCMTDISSRETILSRQLQQIANCGISDVVITTGLFDEVLVKDVKKAFDKNDISIPFPQVDVHMKNK